MRVLSVKQPWAEFIASGQKTIELRTWTTSYRGPLAIAASIARCPRADDRFASVDGARGHIVALVELLDVRPAAIDDQGAACIMPTQGLFSWVLGTPKRIVDPVRFRGGLSLRPLPPDVVALILTRC